LLVLATWAATLQAAKLVVRGGYGLPTALLNNR
jgi:hypothetical protein